MTLKEIKLKYLQIFSLVLETAGEDIGRGDFVEVSRELFAKVKSGEWTVSFNSKKENNISVLEDDEVEFDVYVLYLMFAFLIKLSIINEDNISEDEHVLDKIIDLYKKYLKISTGVFTSKYGLPRVKLEYIQKDIMNIKIKKSL